LGFIEGKFYLKLGILLPQQYFNMTKISFSKNPFLPSATSSPLIDDRPILFFVHHRRWLVSLIAATKAVRRQGRRGG